MKIYNLINTNENSTILEEPHKAIKANKFECQPNIKTIWTIQKLLKNKIKNKICNTY